MNTLLLWGGAVAGPLFIITFLVEGWLRKNYNPIREPVSALSIGPRGWVQQFNFFSSSILLLACAAGLPSALQTYGGSWWAPVLIGIYGGGLFGAGIFVTDVSSATAGGGAPKRSTSGVLHDIFSFFVFASLFAACFVFANLFYAAGETGWHIVSFATGVLYGVGFLLFARGFSPRGGSLAPVAGLIQRATIALGALWLAAVALHLLGLF